MDKGGACTSIEEIKLAIYTKSYNYYCELQKLFSNSCLKSFIRGASTKSLNLFVYLFIINQRSPYGYNVDI